MKVTVSYKSEHTREIQTKEYKAIKVRTDSHFVNITDEYGELYAYPHCYIVSMRIDAQVEENA